jgi:hypothetical protein
VAGKLRERFWERTLGDMTSDLEDELIQRTILDIVDGLCLVVVNRLVDVYDALARIEGITEINNIRADVRKLMEDLQ